MRVQPRATSSSRPLAPPPRGRHPPGGRRRAEGLEELDALGSPRNHRSPPGEGGQPRAALARLERSHRPQPPGRRGGGRRAWRLWARWIGGWHGVAGRGRAGGLEELVARGWTRIYRAPQGEGVERRASFAALDLSYGPELRCRCAGVGDAVEESKSD